MAKRKRDIDTSRDINQGIDILEIIKRYESYKAGVVAVLLWHNLDSCVDRLPEGSLPKAKGKKPVSIIDRVIDGQFPTKEKETPLVQRRKCAISGAKHYAAEGELEKFCMCIVDILLFVPDDVRGNMNWFPPILGKLVALVVKGLREDSPSTFPCINPYNTEEFLASNPPDNDLALKAWDKLLTWTPPKPAPKKGMPRTKQDVPTIPHCAGCEKGSRETKLKRELGLEGYEHEGCHRHNRVNRFRSTMNNLIVDYMSEQQKKLPTSLEQHESAEVMRYDLRKRVKLTDKGPSINESLRAKEKDDENRQHDFEAQMQLLGEDVSMNEVVSSGTILQVQASASPHCSPVVPGEQPLILRSAPPPVAPLIADITPDTTALVGSLHRQSGLSVIQCEQQSLHHELDLLRAQNEANEGIISQLNQTLARYKNQADEMRSQMASLRDDLPSQIAEQVRTHMESDNQILLQRSDIFEKVPEDMKRMRTEWEEEREMSSFHFKTLDGRLGTMDKNVNDHQTWMEKAQAQMHDILSQALAEFREQKSDYQKAERESKERLNKLNEEHTQMCVDLQEVKSEAKRLEVLRTALFPGGRNDDGQGAESLMTLQQGTLDLHASKIDALEHATKSNTDETKELKGRLDETDATMQSHEKTRKEETEALRAEMSAQLATLVDAKAAMKQELKAHSEAITGKLESARTETEKAIAVAQESMSISKSLQDAFDKFKSSTVTERKQRESAEENHAGLKADLKQVSNALESAQEQLDQSQARISTVENQLKAMSTSVDTERLLNKEGSTMLWKVEGNMKDVSDQLANLQKTVDAHSDEVEDLHTKIESTLEGVYGTQTEEAVLQAGGRKEHPTNVKVSQEPLAARIRSLEQEIVKMDKQKDNKSWTETQNSVTLLQTDVSAQQFNITALRNSTESNRKNLERLEGEFKAEIVRIQACENSLKDKADIRMAENIRTQLLEDLSTAKSTIETESKAGFADIKADLNGMTEKTENATEALAQLKEAVSQSRSEVGRLQTKLEEFKEFHSDERIQWEQKKQEEDNKHGSLKAEVDQNAADTKKLRTDLSSYEAIVRGLQDWSETEKASAGTKQLMQEANKTRVVEVEKAMNDILHRVESVQYTTTTQGDQIGRLQSQIKTALGEGYEAMDGEEASCQSNEQQKNPIQPRETHRSLTARILSLEHEMVRVKQRTDKTKDTSGQSLSNHEVLSLAIRSLRKDVEAKNDSLQSRLYDTTNKLRSLTKDVQEGLATVRQIKLGSCRMETETKSRQIQGIDKPSQTDLCKGEDHKTPAQVAHESKAMQAEGDKIEITDRLRKAYEEIKRLKNQLRGDEASMAEFAKKTSEYITKKRQENKNLEFELRLARQYISILNEILSSRDAHFKEIQRENVLNSYTLKRLEAERSREIGGVQRRDNNDAAPPVTGTAISHSAHGLDKLSAEDAQTVRGNIVAVESVGTLGSNLDLKSKQPVRPEINGLVASSGTTTTDSVNLKRHLAINMSDTCKNKVASHQSPTGNRSKGRGELGSTSGSIQPRTPQGECWYIESITSSSSGKSHNVILKNSNQGEKRVQLKKLLAVDKERLVERLRWQWNQQSDKDGKARPNAPPCLRILQIASVGSQGETTKYKVTYVGGKVENVEQRRLLGWGYHVLAMLKTADPGAKELDKAFDEQFAANYKQQRKEFVSEYANIFLDDIVGNGAGEGFLESRHFSHV